MFIPTALALVALSLEVASAAVMFLIARAPGWSRIRLMGWIALSAGAYSAVNLVATLLSNEAPALRWIFEINLVVAAIHGCFWLWFTFADSDSSWQSLPRWARRLGLGVLASTSVVAIGGLVTDQGAVYAVPLGVRGVPTIAFVLSPIGNLLAATILVILVLCGAEYWRRARLGLPGARGILIGFLLFGVCIVEEVLVAAGIVPFYYLSDLGYLFIVVPLASQLLGRVSDDARRLARLSAALASEVEERTSERDAARESLLQQQRLAALGRLAAGVGHEINNPLQYLLASLEELEAEGAGQALPGGRAALANALEGAARIARVVEGLRRYGAASETVERVDLHEVVRTAIRIAEPQVRRVALIEADLAAVPAVLGDEGQLVQCVVNPLVNAAQAFMAPQSGRAARIRIATSTTSDGRACIRLSDNGPGFPESLLPRLGEPYVSTRVAEGGSGLGLFVTHGLVSAHGGSLILRNAADAGGGAVVEILLPAASGAGDGGHVSATPSGGEHATTGQAITALPVAAATGKPRRILIVDDELALVSVLARGLRRFGHEVTTAHDGDQALRLADEGNFDLVLSDLMMPNVSGLELADALAARHPVLRRAMMIMTGGAVSEEHAEFLSRADVTIVEKPVRLAELAAAIALIP